MKRKAPGVRAWRRGKRVSDLGSLGVGSHCAAQGSWVLCRTAGTKAAPLVFPIERSRKRNRKSRRRGMDKAQDLVMNGSGREAAGLFRCDSERRFWCFWFAARTGARSSRGEGARVVATSWTWVVGCHTRDYGGSAAAESCFGVDLLLQGSGKTRGSGTCSCYPNNLGIPTTRTPSLHAPIQEASI